MKLLNRMIHAIAAICIGCLCSTVANAECIEEDDDTSEDRLYMWDADAGWGCQQKFVDYWWDAFNMKNWDGFGFDNPCEVKTPLARTFNALWVLGYSSTNNPHCDKDEDNVTEWSMCWAAKRIKSLKPTCSYDKNAYTSLGSVKVYGKFFYRKNPVKRAAILFHEARHAGGCIHNYRKKCGSCDKSWTNGCTWTGKDDGANRYSIIFLSWFANTAFRTTDDLRSSAIDQANTYLTDRFRDNPCFELNSRGVAVQTC